MFKTKRFIFPLPAVIFFIACSSTPNAEKSTAKPAVSQNERRAGNWINEDTWICPVDASWDRRRFFLEGKGEAGEKEARNAAGLQALARQNAETMAREDFLREASSLAVKEIFGAVDRRKLDEIRKILSIQTFAAPQMVTENYTPENDCRILFKFYSPGLKSEIVKVVRKTFGK